MSEEKKEPTAYQKFQDLKQEQERINLRLKVAKGEVRQQVLDIIKKQIEEFSITPSELRKYLKPKRKPSAKKAGTTTPRKPRAKKQAVAK